MIQLHITMTGKDYYPTAKWIKFGDETHNFSTIEEARAFLKDKYGDCKRNKIYVDGEDGKTNQIGYIYGFRNEEWSSGQLHKWLQQDWVEFREVTTINPKEV